MINSRSLVDLHPAVGMKARRHLQLCEEAGIDLLVTSTYRDNESQAELFAQGRTKPGRIVTKANAGESYHNFKCAYDVVPLRAGKPVWTTSGADAKLWLKVGELGELAGLEWGGRWKFKDMPHFQYTAGLTLAGLRAGGIPV
jgi:peptidoglycan L-alanyl-D-glutamate endopeptidase CwlK